MMTGLSAVADLAPAAATDGSAVLAARLSVQRPVSTDDFESLLVEGSELDDSPEAAADPVPVLDPRRTLARAPEAEPPAIDMPPSQDGAVAAPGLMQAPEARAVDTVSPGRTTSDTPVAIEAMPRLSTIASLPAHTHRTAQPVDLYRRGAIEQAVLPLTDAKEPVAPMLAARLFNHRSSAVPGALLNQGMNVATTHVSQIFGPLAFGDATAPTGPSAVVPHCEVGTGATQAELLTDAARAPETAQAVIPATATGVPTARQQKLIDALGERLCVQMAQGMRQAVIRLEPGSNGSIRIELRQNANGMAVHLSATHPEVVFQLQAIGESLRQDLCARHGGDVTVQVSAGRQGHGDASGSGGREHHPRDDAPTRGPGGGLASAGGDSSFELAACELAYVKSATT
ncbi:flagellar hook-length control protein FliK [Burkholderia latens]|uniref:flagellar hook-length control protein FliK n=1 Tax=Burkholderia latens TaxID=488446 RepID=UPI00158CEC43|nr:flagellar hook-length control protein FliK [Burkholderia latens]